MDATVTRFIVSPTVRSSSDQDGTTIIEITENKIYSLIGVASLIWEHLMRASDGMAHTEIVQQLVNEFSAVPKAQIERDVMSIIENFQQRSLIQKQKPIQLKAPSQGYVNRALLRLTVSIVRACRKVGLRLAPAVLLFFLVDLLLLLGRFNILYSLVEDWPITLDKSGNAVDICNTVTAAMAWYPKQAMCLQRSVVTTCILRTSGINAELVIGCQRRPFLVHAWTEIAGEVVNDVQRVRETHHVLDRI